MDDAASAVLCIRRDKELELLNDIDRCDWVSEFVIRDCLRLAALPESLGQMVCLVRIVLTTCPNLEMLPESFGELRALRVIRIYSCGLTQLPNSIGQLCALTDLIVISCHALKSLPETVGLCKNLKTMQLSFCRALTKLPESIGQLAALKELDLQGCDALVWLPVGIGQLDNLSDVQLFECPVLDWMQVEVGGEDSDSLWQEVYAASANSFQTPVFATRATRALRVLCQRVDKRPKLLLLIVAAAESNLPAEVWLELLLDDTACPEPVANPGPYPCSCISYGDDCFA